MPVFYVCAGLIGVLATILTINISRLRRQKRINMGDGGDRDMLAAVRAHANLIEFGPLCLLLIYFVSDFYGFRVVAGLSVAFLVSRVLHAGGMLGYIPQGRFLGALGTTLVLAVTSVLTVMVGIILKQF